MFQFFYKLILSPILTCSWFLLSLWYKYKKFEINVSAVCAVKSFKHAIYSFASEYKFCFNFCVISPAPMVTYTSFLLFNPLLQFNVMVIPPDLKQIPRDTVKHVFRNCENNYTRSLEVTKKYVNCIGSLCSISVTSVFLGISEKCADGGWKIA